MTIPGGLSAVAPQQDVLVGRVEVREVATPQAWLGVKFRGVTTRDSVRIVLTAVAPGSPAARAGLQSGDRLLRVNGAGATTGLIESLAPRMEPGDPFTFTVLRRGETIDASLVAERRPASGDIMVTEMQSHLDTLRKLIGISLDSLERAGLRGLPSLEVRRIDAGDGSVTLVVSTDGGTVMLSEGGSRPAVASWSTLDRITSPAVQRDSIRARQLLPVATPAGPGRPGESGRFEVRIRPGDDKAGSQAQGWTISSPLSPYEEGSRRVAGAELHAVGPDLGRYLGTDRGLMVADVTPGTPAAIAGLRPGDVLVEVDGVALDTVREFRDLMSIPSRVRSLTVVREGVDLELTLRR